MRLGTFGKVAQIAFLFTILVVSMVSIGLSSQSSNTISSTGSISYWPRVDVTVNLSKVIGGNNLSLGFMLDWEWKIWRDSSVRRQLAEDAGFKMVRLFSHRIEPCTYWNESANTGTFNWVNVDSLVQRVFEIGAEPLICIGFCDSSGIIIPPGMAVNSTTELPYPESFATYCREWVRHFKSLGLPARYYEVINEAWFYFYPNWNWNEVKAAYFLQLFNTCYNLMHDENPQIYVGNDASLYKKFLEYWVSHGGKLDTLNFHKYDSWGLSYSDEQGLDSAERKFFDPSYDWNHLTVSEARQIWGEDLPVINSEGNWGASWKNGTDPRIQQVVGAVWTALMLRGYILNNVDYSIYYTFSSSKSYAESHLPQGYGFGMVNHDDNQPWYPYYVQKMIGNNLAVGDQIVETMSSSSDIRPLTWIHEDKLNILLVCKVDEPRTVNLQGLGGQLTFFKIDNTISWETPSVQTGVINHTDPLNINSYTVMLLQTST